ncbi:MAG: hypothetical protein U9P38_01945 [Campylobacterota bacterium]|nr:hypothetical protein [Campylobacterota bacterium]
MPDSKPHYDIPLHDIKPLLEVPEYSLYYLVALTLVTVSLLIGIAYLLFRWFQKKDNFNIRKEHFKFINSTNIKETKKTAYLITLYGATFKDDSPRHLEMYKNLTDRLQEYKYKKDVDAFNDEVKGYIELYKGMIDV